MKYLTAKKLNTSDDKRIKNFDKSKAELVDADKGIYGIKLVKPSRTEEEKRFKRMIIAELVILFLFGLVFYYLT